MRPNFLIIGAMKAGTTSLHGYLADHPQVFMSSPKELRFFDGRNWERGPDWYESHFAPAAGMVAVGEASPAYSQVDIYPEAPGRILEYLPGVKLVYVVREPIARMRSMYVHMVASGRERRTVAEALGDDPVYINSSRYRWQIDHYLPHAGRDRVLVITSEGLRDRRRQTVGEVLAFLGADGALMSATLADERHQSSDKRRRTALSRRLGGSSWYRSVGRRLPPPVRQFTSRLTTRPISGKSTEIPPALEAELREQLASDVAGLRELLPPGWDGWGIG